jgi:hypothetical protein
VKERLTSRVLIWLASGDIETLRPGVLWGTNARRYGWVDEVRFVVFGAAEQTLPTNQALFRCVIEAEGTTFCRSIADGLQISAELERQGATVDYVGPAIAEMIDQGWRVLVF